ncbi:MAG: hypothetical protein AAGA28_09100 [Pseudomonadota bacterium]
MDDKIETSAEIAESAAMPRCHEVHADPCRPPTDVPDALAQEPVTPKSPAQWAYERLILYLQNFEKTLDNQHELAMGFTGSDVGVLRIEGMGFFDPDIITFYGSDMSGAKTQLVQHVSQLSVMLRAVPKRVEESEPLRIGFQLAQALEKT